MEAVRDSRPASQKLLRRPASGLLGFRVCRVCRVCRACRACRVYRVCRVYWV